MATSRKENKGKLYQMYEGNVPKEFKNDFDESIFNSKGHREVQSHGKWHSFHLLRRDKKKVWASTHFCVTGADAVSPSSAPFGSIEVSDASTAEQLHNLIQWVEDCLVEIGVKRILIKCAPEHYDVRRHNLVSVLLHNHGFTVANAELGACLQVSETPFEDIIDKWEKRKLKQGVRANLTFKKIPLHKLKDIYQFILSCREERGHSLSMTYEELNETVKKLPNTFMLFAVYQQDVLVAASISIRVNKKIVYNFYSAHSRKSDSLSPVVFLISEMYSWCLRHYVNLLDLGTSASGGKPNFPLIDFKLRLGAKPSMKLTFEKKIG